MAQLEAQANGWAGKLDEQDLGKKKRGRKLSDSGAMARFSTPCPRRIWARSSRWT